MSYKDREQYWILDSESGSVELGMLQHMHPAVVLMIAFTNFWCYSNQIKPVWTSWMRTNEQNKALGATDVHLYRGADLSDKKEHGWTTTKRTHFERDFRSMFSGVGALSYDKRGALKRIPLIRHNSGHGSHYHMQVAPTAEIEGLRSLRPQGLKEARAQRNTQARKRREQNKDS